VTFTPTPGPSGLVLALGFNEGSGTTAADASGNGNAGTLDGATWTTNGKFGNALSFDGTNDWVTVNDANSLDLVNGMTLEAWVYPTALGTTWRTILMKEWDAYYYLYANTDQGPGTGVNIGGYKEIYSATDLPLNAWTHVAGTWDGATLRLYMNGSPVATLSQSGSLTNSSDPLRIGGNAQWGEYFAGRIDEVRIYNRALSPAEIQADMNAPIASAPTWYAADNRVAGLAAPVVSATPTESLWTQVLDLLTGVGRDIATYAPPARGLAAPALQTTLPPGQIWKTYYSAGSQLIAMRVITTGGNALYFLHGDHLGSTSLTTDASGNVVARQLYDAWGNIRASASSGTMPTDIGYTGQRLDATGLMYFRARYYASSLGRFVSADTQVLSPSDPQQLNRYAYARGNPVRYTDPTGHYIFEDDPNEGLVYDADRVQRHFGVKVRLRESDESWVRDTGHHPTDAEFVGTIASPPLLALGAALLPEIGGIPGAIEGLSWRATAACADNPVCVTLLMGGGAKAASNAKTEIPAGYTAEEWAARQQVVASEGGKYLCHVCAKAMNVKFGDRVVALSANKRPGALLGPGGSDIGADGGWHMMTIDRLGNAWDNFGFMGNAVDYLDRLFAANPSGVSSRVSHTFADAWNWLITGGHQ
jgi:RHS repeat-associated protein